jgi:hypothetical protein
VTPLEGLWWADDTVVFEQGKREAWKWTPMIVQPAGLKHDRVKEIIAKVRVKKASFENLDALRFERLDEGLCAQLLHVGPCDSERPSSTPPRVHGQQPGAMQGKHQEIYLSDASRTAPKHLKTIIRQPYQSKGD